MSTSEGRRKAREFRKEFHIKDCTLAALMEIFKRQGFTVIEFNPVLNDADVSTVISSLGLEELASRTSGFIYTDGNYRLVFVDERLSEEEKRIVLAHEEGHYYCGHTDHSACVGENVLQEFEANEFAHYILRKSLPKRFKNVIPAGSKWLLFLLLIVMIVRGVVAEREYRNRQMYEGDYFVTEHGEKYHLRNCVTIQGHEVRRLTQEDVERGAYSPCNVCLPDQ